MKTKSELAAEKAMNFHNEVNMAGYTDVDDWNDGHPDVYNAFRQYVERASDAMQAILDAKEVTELQSAIKAAEWMVLPRQEDPAVQAYMDAFPNAPKDQVIAKIAELREVFSKAGLKITEA